MLYLKSCNFHLRYSKTPIVTYTLLHQFCSRSYNISPITTSRSITVSIIEYIYIYLRLTLSSSDTQMPHDYVYKHSFTHSASVPGTASRERKMRLQTVQSKPTSNGWTAYTHNWEPAEGFSLFFALFIFHSNCHNLMFKDNWRFPGASDLRVIAIL